MKNLFKSMMLVAAAAMGFAACTKDAAEAPATAPAELTKTLTVKAAIESTRISLNGDHSKFVWTAGDQLGAFTATSETPRQSSAYAESLTSFGIEVDQTAVAGTEVYAYYPYYSNNTDKTSVSLYVSSTQNQAEAGKLTGINASGSGQYPMVAKGTIDANDEVSLSFHPVASAFALNIYGAHETGEVIESVSFTPAGAIKCSGMERVDLTALTDDFKYTAADGNSSTNTVTLGTPFEPDTEKPAAEEKNAYGKQVYICVAKVNYEQGGTFVVNTSKNTYTFTTANELDCSGCNLYVMNLNLEKGETPAPVVTRTYTKVTAEPEDWTGTYIIAYEGNVLTGFYKNATGSSSQYLGKETVSIFDETTITCETAYEITIEKSTAEGYYTLKNSAGQYIGWASGTNGKIEDEASSDNFLWELKVVTAQTQQAITTKGDSQLKRNIRYNGSTDYRIYSGTTTGSAPSFYTISGPAVSVSEKTFALAADDTDAHTFTYSVSGDGAELSAVSLTQDSGADWLNAQSDNNGTITYSATTENTTGAPRTATLTLSIPDGNSVTVTISQAAPAKKLALELSVEGTVVSWTADPAASGYNYTVTADAEGTGEVLNSAENTTATSLDLSKLGLETGTYYVHVTALGDNITTLDSDTAHSTGIAVEKSEVKKYVKVTTALTDWSGEYLIVYESEGVAFNGELTTLDAASNTISVTIDNDEIESTTTTDNATFTIEAISGGYSIKSKSGYYIYQTTDENAIKSSKTTTGLNTISLNSDLSVDIISSKTHLRYNSDSKQKRFRYFKSSTYTNQKAIYLYKLQ